LKGSQVIRNPFLLNLHTSRSKWHFDLHFSSVSLLTELQPFHFHSYKHFAPTKLTFYHLSSIIHHPSSINLRFYKHTSRSKWHFDLHFSSVSLLTELQPFYFHSYKHFAPTELIFYHLSSIIHLPSSIFHLQSI